MLRRPKPLAPIALALALAAAPANASGPACQKLDPKTGLCTIEIPQPGPRQSTTPVQNPSGGTAPKCTRNPNIAVPCSDPQLGFWLNSLQVYCKQATPQPPLAASVWQGHAGGGAVYDCTDPFGGGNFPTGQLWFPSAPGTTVSPEEAAQTVVRRMDLRAADIGIVPENKPGSIGAVGAPVYLWTKPGPTTFGPQTLTGTAGGVTITATAKVDRIVWDMGDGVTVTCRTPGTVYQDRYGFNDSPDCGHRYTRTSAGKPNNAYPIAARSYWVVNWTGPAGSTGRITLDLVSRTNIVEGELQALATN
jgi:hypothetical protein